MQKVREKPRKELAMKVCKRGSEELRRKFAWH